MSNILFVDDEPHILKSVVRLFRSIDREIVTVSSGLEAIEYLEKNTVAVLVTDQRMPGMSGIELISYVKKSILQSYVLFYLVILICLIFCWQ